MSEHEVKPNMPDESKLGSQGSGQGGLNHPEKPSLRPRGMKGAIRARRERGSSGIHSPDAAVTESSVIPVNPAGAEGGKRFQDSGQGGLSPEQKRRAIEEQKYDFVDQSASGGKPAETYSVPAVETPPVTPRTATMNPLPKAKRDEILRNMKILSDAGKQAKLRAVAEAELKAKSSKEFLRGQFLKQVEEIGAGAIDRKAAAAEFKAKYNPYAKEEKADAESDQRKKEIASSPAGSREQIVTTEKPVESAQKQILSEPDKKPILDLESWFEKVKADNISDEDRDRFVELVDEEFGDLENNEEYLRILEEKAKEIGYTFDGDYIAKVIDGEIEPSKFYGGDEMLLRTRASINALNELRQRKSEAKAKTEPTVPLDQTRNQVSEVVPTIATTLGPETVPAAGLTRKPFLPSDSLRSGRMRRALAVEKSTVLPGIKALDDVGKDVKLRAAQEAAVAASAVPAVVPEVPIPDLTTGPIETGTDQVNKGRGLIKKGLNVIDRVIQRLRSTSK